MLQSFKPKYTDWIALYERSSIRKLEEFIAVETDLMTQSPTKYGFNHVKFLASQLKDIKCDKEYEFVYGDKFNEVVGTIILSNKLISKPFCVILDTWNQSFTTFHS